MSLLHSQSPPSQCAEFLLASDYIDWRLTAPHYLEIEAAVAHVFEISADQLRQTNRGEARIALARQVAMYLAHVACQMNYTLVGHLFHRDRTTVAHGCGVVEDRRDDPRFDRAVDLLERVILARTSAANGFAGLLT